MGLAWMLQHLCHYAVTACQRVEKLPTATCTHTFASPAMACLC